jgi:hypothetical protein
MPRKFKTIADELLVHAEVVGDHFESRGFAVRVEKSELGFPYTPTFLCKRDATTIIIEVDGQLRQDRLEAWARYCRSCGKDTRLVVCLPSTIPIPADGIAILRQKGVGLYSALNDRLDELIAPADLALNVQLPEANTLSLPIRRALGGAYDQFQRTQWREGFEESCQTLEVEARRYLKKWSRTGRIKILRKKGPVTLTNAQIDKMTMGQLADTFRNIQAQNHADSVIGQALATINRDRVGVVHHKKRKVTERRLRANVGQHMWTIVAALKELV